MSQFARRKYHLQRPVILRNLVALRYSIMPTHFQLNDSDFIRRFADCSFPPEWFNHEAHLRLAYLHLQQYGLETAIENISLQIKRYDAFWTDGKKFHQTMTEAGVKVVNHFMTRSRSTDFVSLLEEFPKLRNQFKSLLESHYSKAKLQGEQGRTTFLEPDLLSF